MSTSPISDFEGPSQEGHPHDLAPSVSQGERPQLPAATVTVCSVSALPPASGALSSSASSLPTTVPVFSASSAAGHPYGIPPGIQSFPPYLPSPWHAWSGMYGHLQGPPAYGGSAPFPAMDPRFQPSFTGTSAFGGSAPSAQVGLHAQPSPSGTSVGGAALGMSTSLQAQPSLTGASAFGGSTQSLRVGSQMMPPPGSSALGGSAPRLSSDPHSHPVSAGSTAFGSSVSGPHMAFQPPLAVQPCMFSDSVARPPSATQSDAAPLSEDEERDEESRVEEESRFDEEEFSYSFSEALNRLSIVSPDLVGLAPGSNSSLSAAERSLGCKKTKSSAFLLREAAVVSEAFNAAQAKARGGADVPVPVAGTVPILPSALPVGTFAKLGKVPRKKSSLLSTSFPLTSVSVTQEDLLLLGGSNAAEAKSLTIKDKALQDLSHMAARGLEATSVMDSFLGGLVDSIKDQRAENFAVREEIDSGDVICFIHGLVENMKFVAEAFSTLQVNLTLARRDGLLAKSNLLKKSVPSQHSLRAVPVSSSHLFGGGHIPPTIHDLAETKRDFALALPRGARSYSADRSHKQGSSKQGSSYRSSKGRGGGRGRSASSHRSGGSKPYERRSSTPKAGKQHPQ